MCTETEYNQNPDYTFTVSARSKAPNVPVFLFLRRHFGHLPLGQIESLFGFVEHCTLYGCRIFAQRELSDRDVILLNGAGIGVRLPLSNHLVSRENMSFTRVSWKSTTASQIRSLLPMTIWHTGCRVPMLPGHQRARPDRMIDFALEPLVDLGFRSFKLLRSAPGRTTGF